jgi:hypothetical protein
MHLRNEFLYTLRLYALCLLQTGDLTRLRELFLDFKFALSWVEERALDHHQEKAPASTTSASAAIGSILSKESAVNNVL